MPRAHSAKTDVSSPYENILTTKISRFTVFQFTISTRHDNNIIALGLSNILVKSITGCFS